MVVFHRSFQSLLMCSQHVAQDTPFHSDRFFFCLTTVPSSRKPQRSLPIRRCRGAAGSIVDKYSPNAVPSGLYESKQSNSSYKPFRLWRRRDVELGKSVRFS